MECTIDNESGPFRRNGPSTRNEPLVDSDEIAHTLP